MIDIISLVDESKRRKIKVYPCHTNRASNLGDPCIRRLVYERTHWREKKAYDIGLQYIFDQGKAEERIVLAELEDAGIQVIEQQRPFEWKKYQITGSIDGKILTNESIALDRASLAIPIEIKSFSPFNWMAIDSVTDMLRSKQSYMQKYPAQMTLYLLMDNKEEGLFILKNKVTGRLKQIPILLDYEYGEALLKRAEAINKHILEDTLPDRAEDFNLCDGCYFFHVCLPDINRGQQIDDAELETLLNRRDEIRGELLESKELQTELDQIEREIKGKVEDKEMIMVGPWLVQGKWIEKKGFEIKPSRYWQMKIGRI